MRTPVLVGIVLIASAAIAGDKMQKFNVKPGLWEVTNTVNTNGAMPFSDEMLSRLTPEQRARVEARMKAQSGSRSHSTTYKSCVTEQDLDRGKAFGDQHNNECTQTVVKSTATMAEVHVVCEAEGMKSNGTVKMQALSPESVKGSTEMTATGSGRSMTSNSTLTARWVSASCGKTK